MPALSHRVDVHEPEAGRDETGAVVDKIMDLPEASVAKREEEVARLRNPPEFKSLRQHPRMVRVLQRIGAET